MSELDLIEVELTLMQADFPGKLNLYEKQTKRDRGGIAAIVYFLSIIGIVTAYTISTAMQIAFG